MGVRLVSRRPQTAGAHDPLHRGPARHASRATRVRSRSIRRRSASCGARCDPIAVRAMSTRLVDARPDAAPDRPRRRRALPDDRSARRLRGRRARPARARVKFETEHHFDAPVTRVADLMLDPQFEASVQLPDSRSPKCLRRKPRARSRRCGCATSTPAHSTRSRAGSSAPTSSPGSKKRASIERRIPGRFRSRPKSIRSS